jgi:hypothetical protein
MQKCESFSRDLYTAVTKTLIRNTVVPLVEEVVSKYSDMLKLKQDVRRKDLSTLFGLI